jgi:RHS repeat-associated protein
MSGNVTQHVEYVPFGEVFIEEHNNKWSTPYKFNGKELDEETGLYYYGARYYDPRVSLWLGVDPSQEKYPSISTYAYALENPLKFIDIDGRDPVTGIGEAVSSFALSVGMDFMTGWFIEGKSPKKAFDEIGWWSASWDAAKTYALASFTLPGTATGRKMMKLTNSKLGKISNKNNIMSYLFGDIIK